MANRDNRFYVEEVNCCKNCKNRYIDSVSLCDLDDLEVKIYGWCNCHERIE
ncbi:MAG: hypothetical protein ACRCX2_11315 [Paraclostridium sp.]